ncbi:hypothetical protein [Streptantibioticus silvisoli]|uniref:Uncharacterized protein n=1 Tax=Streptantibioticus silvisoli TaxID=2705255 RepID=A0ABT6VVI3_9ACTN|nr:hypothetical protein [Streptantibioticus silvisoli]MDI5962029.1 hypothetical protein [Streptantibioticus silvisoli]
MPDDFPGDIGDRSRTVTAVSRFRTSAQSGDDGTAFTTRVAPAPPPAFADGPTTAPGTASADRLTHSPSEVAVKR